MSLSRKDDKRCPRKTTSGFSDHDFEILRVALEDVPGDETPLNRLPFESDSPAPSDNSSRTNGSPQQDEPASTASTEPSSAVAADREPEGSFNRRFVEFFRILAELDATTGDGKLFPKKCRVCNKEFQRFSEYLCSTTPKGHVFEDCKEVMGKPFTMMYRHCPCGNTLVLSLTEQSFPRLDLMWSVIRDEAAASGRPLLEVVKEFSRQCDQYVLGRDNPCTRGNKRS